MTETEIKGKGEPEYRIHFVPGAMRENRKVVPHEAEPQL